MLDHDIYDDTNTDLEPLWLLDPAADAVAINAFDATRVPTLQGLRSTADRVLDGASRSLGITRAEAHQDLWSDALAQAASAYTQVREEGACLTMAELRDRVLAHLARTPEDHQCDVANLLATLSRPDEMHFRPLVHARHMLFLTGVAVWLPLIGHTMDALHAEGPTIGALLRDHLDLLGVTDVSYGPIDGHGPEGLEIGAPKGRILVSASDELLSVPLGATTGLLATHDSADADPGALIHSTDEAPVTATDLQVMAHKVATALDALHRGEALPEEKDTPTVRDVLMGCLRRAGYDPRPYSIDAFEAVEAHRRDNSSAVVYNAVKSTLNVPLAHYQGLQVIRFEPGADPTTDAGCLGWDNYPLWDATAPASEVLREMTSVVAAITADAAHPWY